VLGAGPRATASVLVFFLAVTPVVGHVVAPYARTDWLDNGLHVADGMVGWVTLRYLLVDGNYPVISWMAFPLMGILFWQTARRRSRILAWLAGSLGVAALAYATAARTAPAGGTDELRRWLALGWTPSSAIFLLTAGGGALAVVSALLWRWGTAAMPRGLQPLVLFGRASLSHYVFHIVVAYSLLRLRYPDEDWAPRAGLWAFAAYLTVGVPFTVLWFRRYSQGPFETLWARVSRRPRPRSADAGEAPPAGFEVIRNDGVASLHAVSSFASGEVIFPLDGRPVAQPTRFTIQIGKDAHLDPMSERASPWGYTNHSCDPNLTIDVARRLMIARRPIVAGEELCFNYNTTEWAMHEPFHCHCGSAQCVGLVQGFAHLSPARQEALLNAAATHIRALHAARAAQRSNRGAAGSSLGIESGVPSPLATH
jgi:uncharacterized protein DUF418/SET domain-containing protein